MNRSFMQVNQNKESNSNVIINLDTETDGGEILSSKSGQKLKFYENCEKKKPRTVKE